MGLLHADMRPSALWACFMSTYVNVCVMGAVRGHINHGQQCFSLGKEISVPSRLRMRSCHEHRVLKAHQTVIYNHIWDPKVSSLMLNLSVDDDTGLKTDVSMKGEWGTVNFKHLS